MKKKELLTQKPAYRNFINKRDQVLENLLIKTNAEVCDLLRLLMINTQSAITAFYPLMPSEISHRTVSISKQLNDTLEARFNAVIPLIVACWVRLRKNAYILANAGEQRAIANTGIGSGNKVIPQHEIHKQAYDDTAIGPLTSRVHLSMMKIRNEIMEKIRLSKILDDGLDAALKRAMAAFPQGQVRQRLNVLPRAYKEAARENATPQFDYVTETEWDDILDAYKKEYVPQWRDPRVPSGEAISVGEAEGEGGYLLYPWEVEQQITEDFVQKVRNGENDAAKANGITDLVWVAIMDDRTDECCVWRDGLTTSQIEAKLKDEHADDECQAVTPPAHFNCRCRLVPAAKGLEEISGFTDEEFDTWLNS